MPTIPGTCFVHAGVDETTLPLSWNSFVGTLVYTWAAIRTQKPCGQFLLYFCTVYWTQDYGCGARAELGSFNIGSESRTGQAAATRQASTPIHTTTIQETLD